MNAITHPVNDTYMNATLIASRWHLYIVRNQRAVSVYDAASIDACRRYCRSIGKQLLIGTPSVPWA